MVLYAASGLMTLLILTDKWIEARAQLKAR